MGDHQRIPTVECFCFLALKILDVLVPYTDYLNHRIFAVTFVALGLFVNNATFTIYRRSQESHIADGYRHPSGSYMQNGPQMIGGIPATPHIPYGQQHGWQESQTPYGDQTRLDYQRSPSKEYGRSRSRSPEKKRLMM